MQELYGFRNGLRLCRSVLVTRGPPKEFTYMVAGHEFRQRAISEDWLRVAYALAGIVTVDYDPNTPVGTSVGQAAYQGERTDGDEIDVWKVGRVRRAQEHGGEDE